MSSLFSDSFAIPKEANIHWCSNLYEDTQTYMENLFLVAEGLALKLRFIVQPGDRSPEVGDKVQAED